MVASHKAPNLASDMTQVPRLHMKGPYVNYFYLIFNFEIKFNKLSIHFELFFFKDVKLDGDIWEHTYHSKWSPLDLNLLGNFRIDFNNGNQSNRD